LTIVFGVVNEVKKAASGGWSATCIASDPYGLAIAGSRMSSRDVEIPFNVLIVSASSETTATERGSAAFLLRSFLRSQSVPRFQPIRAFKMFVGLSNFNGALRVLGSASQNEYLVNRRTELGRPQREYTQWHDSLCAQARMPNGRMGIAVGAAAIAMANGYYSVNEPDTCANTTLSGNVRRIRGSQWEPFVGTMPDGCTPFPRHA
jgi:hypothetical protein